MIRRVVFTDTTPTLPFVVEDENGDAINISTWTITLMGKININDPNSEAIINNLATVITDGPNGAFTVTLTVVHTANPQDLISQFHVDKGGGVTDKLQKLIIAVEQAVRRV